MKSFLARLGKTTLLFTGSALLAAAAHAGEMTVYADDNFAGRAVTLRGPASDFVPMGFNDRVSSVVVRSGTWQLCEHINFQGRCIELPRGEYRRLEGFNDKVSSAREVDDRDRGGRGDRGGYDDRGGRGDRDDRDGRDGRGGGYGRGEDIVLFAQSRFGGRHIEPRGEIRNLTDVGFNDQTGSVIINEGRWELCDDAKFRGRCITLGPGRYEYLNELNNRVSSVRRVR